MTVGPGDGITPHAGGHGRLRASNSDRARVIDNLKAAYVDGLVTKDEFDDRVSQALASRTRAELALVTADLPRNDTSLGPCRHEAMLQQTRAPGPGNRAIIATAVFAGLALVISISAGAFASPAAVMLLLGGAGSAFVLLILLRNRMRGRRMPGPSGEHGGHPA